MTEVLRQGYLVKSPPIESGSGGMKGWKRRWFILRNDVGKFSLQYFEQEATAVAGRSPKGTILLQDCTCIQNDMKHHKHKNVFAVAVPTRTYYLVAESRMDMEEWTTAICRLIGFHTGQTMTLPRATSAEAVSLASPVEDGMTTFARRGQGRGQNDRPSAAPRPSLRKTQTLPGLQAAAAVPMAAGTGAQTLRRTSMLDGASASAVQPCLVNREVILRMEKRFAQRTIAFVDALSGVWVAGWNHNVPALSGVFKFGDQVLRIDSKPVSTAEEANRGIDVFSGSTELEVLVLRTPWALEAEIQRRSRSEPLGVALKENKITGISPNGAASQCGISEQAIGLNGSLVPWIITEVNSRPVSIVSKIKDETFKLMHASGMAVTLLMQPEDFVKIVFKVLKAKYKNYQDFMPR